MQSALDDGNLVSALVATIRAAPRCTGSSKGLLILLNAGRIHLTTFA